MASSQQHQFLTLNEDDIDEMMKQLCEKTAAQCDVSAESALALLRSTRWNWPTLYQKLCADKVLVLSTIGLAAEAAPPHTLGQTQTEMQTETETKGEQNEAVRKSPGSASPGTPGKVEDGGSTVAANANTVSFTCAICYDDVQQLQTLSMECGHRFCTQCWKDHARSSMAAGAQHLWTVGSTCPQHGCCRFVPTDVFISLLDTNVDKDKFTTYLRNHFVDNCPLLSWCSSALSCQHAIALSPSAVSSLQDGIGKGGSAATQCSACGHTACFDCGKAPHGVATCEQADAWLKYYSIVEEASGSQESKQNDEKWLAQHTRPCPDCKSPIQRNFGCNHMTCNCCGCEFCWVCMQPWSTHGAQTGGFFRCDVNNEKSTQEKLKELRAEQLEKGTGRTHVYVQLFKRSDPGLSGVSTATTTKGRILTSGTSSQVLPSQEEAVLFKNISSTLGPLSSQLQDCLLYGKKQLAHYRSALRWFYVLHWNEGLTKSLHGSLFLTHVRAFEILLDHYQQLLYVPLESIRNGITSPSVASVRAGIVRVEHYGSEVLSAFNELQTFASMLREVVGTKSDRKLENRAKPLLRAQTLDVMIEEMLGGLRGEQKTSNPHEESKISTKSAGSSMHTEKGAASVVSGVSNAIAPLFFSGWKGVYCPESLNDMREAATTAANDDGNTDFWPCALCGENVSGSRRKCSLCGTIRYSAKLAKSITGKLTVARKFWSFDKACWPKIKDDDDINSSSSSNSHRNSHDSDDGTIGGGKILSDWKCADCTTANERFRRRCQTCSARRFKNRTFSPPTSPARPTPPRPTTPWACVRCTFINPNGVNRCAMCRARRPPLSTMLDNLVDTSSQQEPSVPQQDEELLPPYNCSACTFACPAGDLHCEICMTPRGTTHTTDV
jgi:hypothetical protein